MTSGPSLITACSRASRRSRRGSALLMVLWLISLLGMIIYSTVAIVKLDGDLTIAQKQAFRARQLTEMGLNIAMNPAVKKFDRALLFQMVGDGDTFDAKIKSEGGRFNINSLLQTQDRDFLERLFVMWGLSNDDAKILVDRLIDWTDAGDEKEIQGAEREDYESEGLMGLPYNRPFYNLDELPKVPGFTAITSRVSDWKDYFTIYSAGKLDLNEAEAKVLAAARVASDTVADPTSGFEHYVVEAQDWIVTNRYGPDGERDTEDDTPVQDVGQALTELGIAEEGANRFSTNDATVQIEVTATVGDYQKRLICVVRNRNANPQILTREEVPLSAKP